MEKRRKIVAFAVALMILVSVMASFQRMHMQSHALPIRVACVGDSITENSGYPSDLQSLLGSNYSVGNFGVSGSTVSLNSWKPYMNQSKFQDAEDFEPNIVVIMLGTNDDLRSLHLYNESFEDDYNELISSFQQVESNPRVMIATSPPIFSNSSDLSPTYLTNTIIPKTEDVASNLNLPVIDIYSAFANQTDCFVDGVHPNSQGASVIASEVYDAINAQYPTP